MQSAVNLFSDSTVAVRAAGFGTVFAKIFDRALPHTGCDVWGLFYGMASKGLLDHGGPVSFEVLPDHGD
jgi:hypothetical protein